MLPGARPVQLTAIGAIDSSACHVAGVVAPVAGSPWLVWKLARLAAVVASKMPVVAWLGIAAARCSCIQSTWSPLLPLARAGQLGFGVTEVSGASGAASAAQPALLVSWKSQNDQPLAP